MRWLCARGLARLWSLGESERPPPVALLTALLPALWEEDTAKELATVLEEPICPGGLVDGGGREWLAVALREATTRFEN